MNTDHGQGMQRRSVGDSKGSLLEVERAFRESLLSGSKHNRDTGTSITFGGQRAEVIQKDRIF